MGENSPIVTVIEGHEEVQYLKAGAFSLLVAAPPVLALGAYLPLACKQPSSDQASPSPPQSSSTRSAESRGRRSTTVPTSSSKGASFQRLVLASPRYGTGATVRCLTNARRDGRVFPLAPLLCLPSLFVPLGLISPC